MGQITGEDPLAGGINTQGVNKDKHALVEAVSKSDIEYQSLNNGRAYVITSEYSAGANDEVLSIECTSSTEVFIIDEIVVSAGAACNFDAFYLAAGTPAGQTVTAKNLNSSSGNSANLTCFGNAAVTGITAATASDIIGFAGVPSASTHFSLDVKDAGILGQNKTLVITATAATTVRVAVYGAFREKPR